MAATTLTSWHLLVTFCSLHVALWMKLFEHKPFDPRTVVGFGILNGISIGLLNLSLGFNSVGFYQVRSFPSSLFQITWLHNDFPKFQVFSLMCQMTKLAIIPCTVFLETIFLSKKFRLVYHFYWVNQCFLIDAIFILESLIFLCTATLTKR